MPAVNTIHTLNDYRLSTEPVYESKSHSNLGAGALVIAIFLGIGAYSLYSTHNRSADTTTAAPGVMNSQSPAAVDNAAPADAIDGASMPSVSDTTVTSPTTPSPDANATRVPARDSVITRTATESQSNVPSARPAQRAKQSTKALTKSTSETTPSATGDAATAIPEMTKSAPIVAPQPAAADQTTDTTQSPVVTRSTAPVEVTPDAVESSGG